MNITFLVPDTLLTIVYDYYESEVSYQSTMFGKLTVFGIKDRTITRTEEQTTTESIISIITDTVTDTTTRTKNHCSQRRGCLYCC